MIKILYREGVHPLLIAVVGCVMNGGWWLTIHQPQCRTTHGGATASAHRRNHNSCHGGPNSTRMVPMGLERWGKTIFAHLVRQQLKQRLRNIGQLAPRFLVDGKLPWWNSGSVLPSYGGGGGKRSFPRTWLGMRRGEAVQRRWGAVPRVWSFVDEILANLDRI
jgi:hypothetical protein